MMRAIAVDAGHAYGRGGRDPIDKHLIPEQTSFHHFALRRGASEYYFSLSKTDVSSCYPDASVVRRTGTALL